MVKIQCTSMETIHYAAHSNGTVPDGKPVTDSSILWNVLSFSKTHSLYFLPGVWLNICKASHILLPKRVGWTAFHNDFNLDVFTADRTMRTLN